MNLYDANSQWASRPSDERYNTLADMAAASRKVWETSREETVKSADLVIDYRGDLDNMVTGKNVIVTNYTHGQISRLIGAPPEFLAKCSPSLHVRNLNEGLERAGTDLSLWIHDTPKGNKVLRCATKESWARISNHLVIDKVSDTLDGLGLVPATPTMRWDGRDPAKVGDLSGDFRPALWMGDRDMFIFLRSTDKSVTGPNGTTLYRGLIVRNTEVANGSALKFKRFLFAEVCGNYIIWDASDVLEVSLRHRGDISGRFLAAANAGKLYLNSSAKTEEDSLKAFGVPLAADKAGTVEKIFTMRGRAPVLTKNVLNRGYDLADAYSDTDGDPRSLWGMVNGLTRVSQDTNFADSRSAIDAGAGALLKLAV